MCILLLVINTYFCVHSTLCVNTYILCAFYSLCKYVHFVSICTLCAYREYKRSTMENGLQSRRLTVGLCVHKNVLKNALKNVSCLRASVASCLCNLQNGSADAPAARGDGVHVTHNGRPVRACFFAAEYCCCQERQVLLRLVL